MFDQPLFLQFLQLLHFQQPLWLWALIPLLLLVWFLSNNASSAKAWQNIIDPKLLPFLLKGKTQQTFSKSKWLLGGAWLLTIVALADPVWEKIPRPIFQTNASRVIVLDLSNSMLVDDIKPTRMARARFKVEDILSKEEEGQIGLVVFAGDAFIAAPLTRDGETIRALLQVLTPRIMPTQGSRADLGLSKAHDLLKQASVTNGQVLLITDGSSDIAKTLKAASSLKADGHSVSVLAVGTETGGTLRLNRQQQVTVKLDLNSLHKTAKKGGGVLHSITNNDADLLAVLTQTKSDLTTDKANKTKNAIKTDDKTDKTDKEAQENSNGQNDKLNSVDWRSTGPLIILLLLPLAALAFRKGWLFSFFISLSLLATLSMPKPVIAATPDDNKAIQKLISDSSEPAWKNFFNNLLKNKEQRAEAAFQNQQYDKAQALTNNPLRSGSAAYKKGDYEQALESFKKSQGAKAKYNQGNALAKLKKYEEAIKAYDEALKQQADMTDAKTNKKALEEFLKQQKQHQPEDQQSDENSKDQKDKDDPSQKNKQNNSDKKNQKQEKEGDKDQNQSGEQGEKGDQQDSKNEKEGKKDKEGNKKGDKKEDKKENQFSEANKEMDEKDKGEESSKAATDDEKNAEEKKAEEGASEEKNAENLSQSDLNNNDKKSVEAQKRLQEKGTKSEAEELNKEEKMAAEQWLRRIPDDPGGLLRRKFQRQYKQRKRLKQLNTNENPW